ncbi:hypothetical protein Avbf_00650 [Armadillidium vulgare]|nr:hypothetical protein Avbf_00650 [Armadillidium vulgare]
MRLKNDCKKFEKQIKMELDFSLFSKQLERQRHSHFQAFIHYVDGAQHFSYQFFKQLLIYPKYLVGISTLNNEVCSCDQEENFNMIVFV